MTQIIHDMRNLPMQADTRHGFDNQHHRAARLRLGKGLHDATPVSLGIGLPNVYKYILRATQQAAADTIQAVFVKHRV